MVPEAGLGLDHLAVAARLRLAMARMVRRIRRQTPGELSASAISVLAQLDRHGPSTLGDLALAEGVSRPAMTVLTAGLAAAGMIRKEPDPVDRRLVRASLTAGGRAALERARSLRSAFFARRLRGLTEDELRTLDRAAGILERLLDEEARR